MVDKNVDFVARWGDLISEVQTPKKNEISKPTVVKNVTVKKRYYLKPPYQNTYFTSQEMQVAGLLMRYDRLLQIANQMHLSERTIEHHLTSLKRKLHCHCKTTLKAKVQYIINNQLFYQSDFNLSVFNES